MVPDGWEQEKLFDLCIKISVGLAISVTPHMRDRGVILIRNQNIRRNRFDGSSLLYLDEKFADKNRTKKIEAGDVIAVRTGSNIGQACVVPKDYSGALTFTTLIARPKINNLISEYLSLHINSRLGISEVQRLSAGGGKPNLNAGELKRYSMLLPPVIEQLKIAQVFSTWDKAIATTESLIANSQQQKKALMQQLLTGKKRFVGFDGEWTVVKLSEICDINPKKPPRPKNHLVSFVPMKAVSEDGMFFSCEEKEYGEVEKGFTSFIDTDVLLAKITPCFENGKGAYCRDLINGVGFGSTEFHVLRAKPETCSVFLYFITKTYEFQQRGEASMQGSGGQRRVPTGYLKNYRINVPPSTAEQQKVSKLLSDAEKEIDCLKQKFTHLKQEKQALMQQLLTGKRRVKVTDESRETEVA